jgi:peptidoglycan/LPS O-acetylase OafA/YrhL
MNSVIRDTSLEKVSTETPEVIYLPGLNGLRAIAAVAVLISHIALNLERFGLNSHLFGTTIDNKPRDLDLARYGVIIFFTLSGFLITFLFLKEKERGHLKIRNFYIRRILRIWPLYYLYLFAAILTLLTFGIDFNISDTLFYIFMAANIPPLIDRTVPFLLHYWSLGVEEQFYLWFPHIARKTSTQLLKTALWLIFMFLLLKVMFWLLRRKYGISLPFSAISSTCFHIMLIGAVGAVLFYHRQHTFLIIATHKLTQIVCWLCIFLISLNSFHIAFIIDGELVALISVFLITGQITQKNNVINLENKLCNFLGRISYGIYMIHPLVIIYYGNFMTQFNSSSVLNYLLVFGLIISTTIILSYISYEFYEKKFLMLKIKFATMKT